MHAFRLSLAVATLVAGASAQRLIAVDSNRTLYDVDMTSGAKVPFGQVASTAGISAGLANDITTGTVYLTSTSLDSVFTLDLATGNVTLIGSYGDPNLVMHGIEYDFLTGTLYGGSRGDLYTIDTTTGLATLVGTGNSNITSFFNLCFDYVSNVMYATESGTDSFYSVDLTTGVATLIGPLGAGSTNPNGLAFDPDSQTIWMVDNSQDNLYTIDRATGTATLVGSTGSGNLLGLMYVSGGGNVRRVPNGCGAATVAATGSPVLGGQFSLTMTGAVGVPFMGLGLVPGNTPVCALCSLGHEWSVLQFGADVTLQIPNNPIFIGTQVGMQGADFGGANGCVAPAVITLTDTIVITIG